MSKGSHTPDCTCDQCQPILTYYGPGGQVRRWQGGDELEHPDYTRQEWRADVRAGDTLLGYYEWVAHQIDTGGIEFNRPEPV